MPKLRKLESKSIYIIREAYKKFGAEHTGLLWSMGKDSTLLMWLVRKAFMGKVPFPVVHIDTSYKFDEMYRYRETLAKEWGFEVKVLRNNEALNKGMNKDTGVVKCCGELKTKPLQDAVKELKLKGLLAAIRRDEHGIRAKERYFSPRKQNFSWDYMNQPMELWDQFEANVDDEDHYRVHPILDWTELDVWTYIAREKIPVIDMYYAKNGKRYRSIGCEPCTEPCESNATDIEQVIQELRDTEINERSGRGQDKEDEETMQKLRSLGYM